jgi:predicted Zn-dependent protease
VTTSSAEQYVNEIPEEFSDVRSDWLQLLMELGYVACGCGKPSHAEAIFTGIVAVRPNSELPLIGLAVTLASFGQLSDARKVLLELAAKINPENQLVKVLAAMFAGMSGSKSECDSLLDDVEENGTDSEAVALAKHLRVEDFQFLRKKVKR